MEIVDILIKEAKSVNERTGSNFNIVSSVHSQIPHFTCMNHLLDPRSQADISRHIFSSEYNVPPYPGTYGDYPKRWVEKVNIISRAMAGRKEKEIAKAKRRVNGT